MYTKYLVTRTQIHTFSTASSTHNLVMTSYLTDLVIEQDQKPFVVVSIFRKVEDKVNACFDVAG
jgi:hypothetical protein